MKRVFENKIFLIIIAFVLGGVFLNTRLAFANDIDSKLSKIKSDLENLQKIEDDITIPLTKKENLEVQLRKEIILNILDVSLSQINGTRNQLASSTNPLKEEQKENWDEVYKYLIDLLDQDIFYYQDIKKEIENNTDLTVSDLKNLAKTLENTKVSKIDKDIAKANNVLAALNVKKILSIANERLEKVGNDIKKIYSNKLIKNQALKNLYNQSASKIKLASDLSQLSWEAILKTYTANTTTSTQEFIESIKEKIIEQKINSISDNNKLQINDSELKINQDDIDSYISKNINEAYNNIKSAYEIFVNMSINLKKLIQ
jgi:hypothetical protein